MKFYLVMFACLVLAGCRPADDPEPVEPLTQPYADKIEQLEQAQIEQAKAQLDAVDRQTSGNKDEGH